MKNSLRLRYGLLMAILVFGSACLADPTMEWSDLFDGGGSLADNCRRAIVDEQGNLIIAGESTDSQDGSDFYIRKLDRNTGTDIWTRRFPAFDGSDMAVTGLNWDAFGDVLVGGYICGCVG